VSAAGAPHDPHLRRFLDGLIASGDASAAVALAGGPERIERTAAAGLARRPDVAATPSTRFDYASLTKPFVATLALRLDAAGRLPLDTLVGEIFLRAAPALAPRPLADLLAHRSGLAAWTPLYARCASREEVLDLLLGGGGGEAGVLLGAPPDTYSDLGYILWGLAAERRLGAPLDRLLREEVLLPLGLGAVDASPGARPDVAESLLDTAKDVELAAAQGISIDRLPPPPRGVVQDGNARFLLGLGSLLPGHAGLFGQAEELWTLGREWLAPGRLLQPGVVASAIERGGEAHALGWQRRTAGSIAAAPLGVRSFGQMGYAGGSLFVDPDRRAIAVLLAHRTRREADMNGWRRRFHALVCAAGSLAAP
jgi:CubicO group peptidase (beta-lactamase class C family)